MRMPLRHRGGDGVDRADQGAGLAAFLVRHGLTGGAMAVLRVVVLRHRQNIRRRIGLQGIQRAAGEQADYLRMAQTQRPPIPFPVLPQREIFRVAFKPGFRRQKRRKGMYKAIPA